MDRPLVQRSDHLIDCELVTPRVNAQFVAAKEVGDGQVLKILASELIQIPSEVDPLLEVATEAGRKAHQFDIQAVKLRSDKTVLEQCSLAVRLVDREIQLDRLLSPCPSAV